MNSKKQHGPDQKINTVWTKKQLVFGDMTATKKTVSTHQKKKNFFWQKPKTVLPKKFFFGKNQKRTCLSQKTMFVLVRAKKQQHTHQIRYITSLTVSCLVPILSDCVFPPFVVYSCQMCSYHVCDCLRCVHCVCS